MSCMQKSVDSTLSVLPRSVMLREQRFKNVGSVVLTCLRKHYLAFTLALSSLVGNREGDIFELPNWNSI